MELNQIIDKLNNIKKGVFTRLVYTSEVPLRACYKKEGYHIDKYSSITTRFGICYGHIKAILVKSDIKVISKNNATCWIVKDCIQYNSNTGKNYLCTYPTQKGNHYKCTYTLTDPTGKTITYNEDEMKNLPYVRPSYFKQKQTYMKKISIDNIISIGC